MWRAIIANNLKKKQSKYFAGCAATIKLAGAEIYKLIYLCCSTSSVLVSYIFINLIMINEKTYFVIIGILQLFCKFFSLRNS